eukprot:m.216918 g.216918  ORF g.216918 m.216918 type:complete len:105 (-) comp26237_c0_seq5:688-1002(-)
MKSAIYLPLLFSNFPLFSHALNLLSFNTDEKSLSTYMGSKQEKVINHFTKSSLHSIQHTLLLFLYTFLFFFSLSQVPFSDISCMLVAALETFLSSLSSKVANFF